MNTNTEAMGRWKWAVGAVFAIAAMNFGLGMLASSNPSGQIGDFQVNGGALAAAGVLYLVLGVFSANRASAALWVAVALFSLDAVAMVLMTASTGHFSMIGLWIRIGLIATMYRGIPALAEMKRPTTPPIPPQSTAPGAATEAPRTGFEGPRTESEAVPMRGYEPPSTALSTSSRWTGYEAPRS